MRRHQFEAYLDKVFDFSDRVAALPEGRIYPRHSWKKVFDAVFLGAACQFPALHQIEAECRRGVLARRIGSLSEDCLGYAMLHQDPAALFALGCDLARRLKRNGLLHSEWARAHRCSRRWHGEKAGTIERVHDVMKNDLAAGVLPSKYFGANGAWLRLAVINSVGKAKRFSAVSTL